MAVNFDVPAATEGAFAHNAQAGAWAHTNVQQFASEVLVGKPFDGARHTGDEVGSGSAANKWHSVAFADSIKECKYKVGSPIFT